MNTPMRSCLTILLPWSFVFGQCNLQWSPASLGNGMHGAVHEIAQLPSGDILAGGDSSALLPAYGYQVWRWHNGAWSVFANVPAPVLSLRHSR
ncbi:MAG: hypothetical protein ABIP94_20445 [Planctomycetota bacterium]